MAIGGRVKEQPRWHSKAIERGCSIILAAKLLHFVTLWPWPFDLILIDGRDIVMDCLCAKFGDFSFDPFFYRADRIAHKGRWWLCSCDYVSMSSKYMLVEFCLMSLSHFFRWLQSDVASMWTGVCVVLYFLLCVCILSGRIETFHNLHRTMSFLARRRGQCGVEGKM